MTGDAAGAPQQERDEFALPKHLTTIPVSPWRDEARQMMQVIVLAVDGLAAGETRERAKRSVKRLDNALRQAESLPARIAEMEQQNKTLTEVNHSAAVCHEHVAEFVGDRHDHRECLVCQRNEAEEWSRRAVELGEELDAANSRVHQLERERDEARRLAEQWRGEVAMEMGWDASKPPEYCRFSWEAPNEKRATTEKEPRP